MILPRRHGGCFPVADRITVSAEQDCCNAAAYPSKNEFLCLHGENVMKYPDSLLRKGLKLAHLRLMAALSETGQIGTAADRIGIAQPAASRLLAEVERICGLPVHQRNGRGLVLTPMGTALARRAHRVLTELRDAEREMAEVAQGATGHVRLGSVTGPALDHLLPALRTARLSLPGVSVAATVGPSDLLANELATGRIDFAIGRVPPGMEDRIDISGPMGLEPVVLMVRRGHRLAQAEGLTGPELMEFDWVMPSPDTILARAVINRLRTLGLPVPNQRLATSSFLLTLALIQQTNAIAPLARAVGERFAVGPEAAYAILPIDLGISVEPYGLMTRKGAILTPAARQLADLILASADDLGAGLTAGGADIS
ncbi:MAG: LysR family transcriptional regulator [Rhodobacteraceae bacterium]|nr:LysR family transcriptional regulator [Paracoccaceae bacterium]